jgi:hypothetical protein
VSGRRRVLATCVALVAAATFDLAHLATPGRAQNVPAARVAVIGDSVLLAARESIVAEFAGWDITIEASESLSLLGALGRLSELAATRDVVVLDLGYNDSTDLVEWRSRVERALGALARVPHVIWLDQRAFQPARDAMNTILVETATRFPNVDVASWNAEAVAHPEYVGPDGIHLVGAGPSAMAALIRARVGVALTPPTTTTVTTTTTRPESVRPERVQDDGAGSRAAPTSGRRRRDATPIAVWLGAAALVVTVATAVRHVRHRRTRRSRTGRQFRARQ